MFSANDGGIVLWGLLRLQGGAEPFALYRNLLKKSWV